MNGGAFYNDNEPFAVKWLGNLIADGYGNSIVPQIAAAFVRAFMDCLSPAGSQER